VSNSRLAGTTGFAVLGVRSICSWVMVVESVAALAASDVSEK